MWFREAQSPFRRTAAVVRASSTETFSSSTKQMEKLHKDNIKTTRGGFSGLLLDSESQLQEPRVKLQLEVGPPAPFPFHLLHDAASE